MALNSARTRWMYPAGLAFFCMPFRQSSMNGASRACSTVSLSGNLASVPNSSWKSRSTRNPSADVGWLSSFSLYPTRNVARMFPKGREVSGLARRCAGIWTSDDDAVSSSKRWGMPLEKIP